MINAEALRNQNNPALDLPLAAWRRFRESGRTTAPSGLPAELVEMARSVDSLFGWSDDDARRAQPTRSIGDPPSAGGVAGFYLLARKAGESAIDFSEASQLAGELALGDDDVVFLLAYSAKSGFGDGQTAGAMMQLAAATLHDDAVAGKLYRTLAAIASDANYQLMCYRAADARLAGGANDALRAEIWNEMAILMASHGKLDEGRALAEAARGLAIRSGASQIALMALGNLAWILMQQRDFAAALSAFEKLARDQEKAGDHANLEITEQNMAICRRNLAMS